MPASKSNRSQKKIIPPEEYKKAVPDINLIDIYFQSGSWEAHQEQLGDKNQIEVDFNTKVLKQDDHHSVFKQKFHLHVIPEGKEEPAVKIECNIFVTCQSESEISKEFWEAYEQISLPVISVPYFRECVHNLTSKMGIPPIIVPHWVR